MQNLSEKAMLVKLSISLPGNSRQDKKLTDEVKSARALGQDSGKWLKTLYPKKAYEPLVQLCGTIRTWHYEHSLIWQDDGWRILPSSAYLDYTAKMREFKGRFETARNRFLTDYDEYVEWARIEHNGTFNPSEYPGAEKVSRKFGFSVDPRPVPDAADFRVSLQAEEVDAIRRRITENTTSAVEEAMKDLWSRLKDPIRHMLAKLKTNDGIFRDSLVENIRDIVGLIPQLNLTDDPQLAAFAEEAKALTVHSAETLRQSSLERSNTAVRAAEILAKMAGYLPVA